MGDGTLLDAVNRHRQHTAFQTSTIGALLGGLDDGDLTVTELLRHGDFGVGTFSALDGEMVVLDGRCYQLRSDGRAAVAPPEATTPYAIVTSFAADSTFGLPSGTALNRDQLTEMIESRLPGDNYFYAIRVDGQATSITSRTVRRQTKPYPGLLEASSGQREQTYTELAATIVGFRSPDYTGTIAVPGYHLHFVDDARRRGGHVLDFVMSGGQVHVSVIEQLRLRLPSSSEFATGELNRPRDSAAIAAAEGARSDSR
ncbi:acetolactate decarboxylase [Actinoplanes auranticolor]|uniref:acetolactate decarboxylase n=1 Tax=Actinoplanes auranticolor TaxID=47988 RepID=UPI001BB402EB|nr:acetolactate decarboxylase [Actinoplanes auranticolor]